MPKTIRKTLLSKLQSSQVLANLKADLRALAGIDLRLVGPNPKASELSTPCSDNLLCQRVCSVPMGCDHCRRFVEQLILETRQEGETSSRQCDASLTSFCVPLKHGGETLGYLLAGGYHLQKLDPSLRNRMRHLFGRMQVPNVERALEEFEKAAPMIEPQKHEAIQRWVELAAETLIRSLDLTNAATSRPMPTYITKICSVIQTKFANPPSLSQAAELCGLSEGYFCRAFHQFTGLRFVEYIHAVRIEHVCEILETSRRRITEIAFDVGFDSLSQFNRVFRKLRGVSPRQWRSQFPLKKTFVA